MKLPLKWLKEYVDFDITPIEFAHRMTCRGFEVAEILSELPGVTNVVVGKILTITPHENANRLRVCIIDIGKSEPVQIVTADSNVREGDIVPVALSGAELCGGIVIADTNMRGVMSYGMLCSGKELGITNAHYPGAEENRVLTFTEELPAGQSIHDALGMNDVIFDIELTPNRADCQSIIGICREAAAALGKRFKEPAIKHVEGSENASNYASVTVENAELCPRYCARVVTDLRIEPSPVWMQKRLLSVGLRPINNIVDITNYVLIEYGHPMHAFDLACVENGAIVVRNARENERITTLDSKERDVTPDMLLIADPIKGVGIAGVMGGENSEITQNTKAALFESAVFSAANIRSTARKLKHVTDSAQRFIRGVEPANAYLALERAIELVSELGAGKVIGKVIDVSKAAIEERVINVDAVHVNKIIGEDFSPEYMAALLESININALPCGNTLKITVPHYRTDIEYGIQSPHDIAEEVARLHGYGLLEAAPINGATSAGMISGRFKDEDKIKDTLAALGAYEMYNYNFMSPGQLSALSLAEGCEKELAVRLVNPFGEDQSLMRTTLIPGMLVSLSLNIKRKTGHGKFFEVGNVHLDNNTDLPEERRKIGLAYIGAEEDFFTLKGTLEQLLEVFGILNLKFKPGGGDYLCPGKRAEILVGDISIGEMGMVHPDTAKYFEISVPAYVAELDMEKLLVLKPDEKLYEPIPRFPAAERDIAVVVDDSIASDTVCGIIESADIMPILDNVRLFDVYKGVNIPEGKKSMAFSFALRHKDRTLTDEEITRAMDTIIEALNKKLGAKIRGA